MSRSQQPGSISGRAICLVVLAIALFGCTDDDERGVESSGAAESITPSTSTATSLLMPGSSGYTLKPGGSALISVGIHCGVRVFPSKLNGYAWETSEGDGVMDWVPNEWPADPVRPDGPLTVEVDLSTGGDTLTLTQNGRSVTYKQSGTEFRDDQLCE